MAEQIQEMDDPTTKRLERLVSGLKIGMIVTIYFSLGALIVLVILGARP